jgi:hypothetical protein
MVQALFVPALVKPCGNPRDFTFSRYQGKAERVPWIVITPHYN